MKKQSYIFLVLVALIAVFVSACGGTATETSAGGDKPRASLVEFTGVIEAIDGNQWTVNGQVITVDPTILRDGPFAVGDTVKVEAEVQSDGSVVITRVEPPVAAIGTDVNSNDNSNANINDDDNDNGNSSLENANGNDNSNSSLGSDLGNGNDNSDDSLTNGNTNSDDHGGNSNGDDDDGSNSNSNGDDDDDHGGNSNGSDDD